jgi:hypothetical protein
MTGESIVRTLSQGTNEIELASLTHAWAWFEHHAKQRTQNLNFFLVASSFLASAYGYAMEKWPEVSLAVSGVGLLMCIVFYGLERRNRQLVKVGEAAIQRLELRLADATEVPELNLVVAAESSDQPLRWNTYGKLVPFAMGTMAIAFLAGAGYALGILVCSQ